MARKGLGLSQFGSVLIGLIIGGLCLWFLGPLLLQGIAAAIQFVFDLIGGLICLAVFVFILFSVISGITSR